MSAFVIVDIEVHDAAAYEDYRKLVGASVSRYEGRFWFAVARSTVWRVTGSQKES